MKRHFVVRTRGNFPFPDDMLRYDECTIVSTGTRGRTVIVETEKHALTAARWDSFGWEVVGRSVDVGSLQRSAPQGLTWLEREGLSIIRMAMDSYADSKAEEDEDGRAEARAIRAALAAIARRMK